MIFKGLRMTPICIIALIMAFSPTCEPKMMSQVMASHRHENYLHTVNNQKHTLVLYYSPYCPYSTKVLKYLKSIHKQLPMKNVADDLQAKAQFKKLGGKMQVPCLVIDGELMYESNDIINWLSQHQDELESANNAAACKIMPKEKRKLALRSKISSSVRKVGRSPK